MTLNKSLLIVLTILLLIISLSGKASAWTQTTSLKESNVTLVLSANSYIYAFSNIYPNFHIQYANISSNGSLSSWSLNTNTGVVDIVDYAGAASDSYIYLSGGVRNVSPILSQVLMAQITTNGSLSKFTSVYSMETSREHQGMIGYNGYLYVLGGDNDQGVPGPGPTNYLTTVEYSKISSNGTLFGWQYTSSMNTVSQVIGTWVSNGFIWVIGKDNAFSTTSFIERALINTNGTLGSWQIVPSPYSTPPDNVTFASDGYLYGFSGISTARRITPHVNGSFSDLQTLETFNKPRWSLPIAYQYYIYSIGGNWYAGDPTHCRIP